MAELRADVSTVQTMTLNPWLDPRETPPVVAAGEWAWVGACLWMSACAWPLWLPPLVKEMIDADRDRERER